MNTVCRCIEVSDTVKRALLDPFTAHLARHVAVSIPKEAGPGRFCATDENIALVVTHKHVSGSCEDWVVAESSCIDLLNDCVRRLLKWFARFGPEARQAGEVLDCAWATAMHEARNVQAAARGHTL
jgi:hypothetical protein